MNVYNAEEPADGNPVPSRGNPRTLERREEEKLKLGNISWTKAFVLQQRDKRSGHSMELLRPISFEEQLMVGDKEGETTGVGVTVSRAIGAGCNDPSFSWAIASARYA